MFSFLRQQTVDLLPSIPKLTNKPIKTAEESFSKKTTARLKKALAAKQL